MHIQSVRTIALALLVAVALGTAAGTAATGVAGQWSLTVKGPAAHGDLTATLALKQDGKAVTGQFSAHGNEHQMKGEFVDGTLTLEATEGAPDRSLSINARLKDDGTLAGYLSSPMGDMAFTGKRDK
jgi:hypothetical protein